MSLLEGAKVSEAGWLRAVVALLSVIAFFATITTGMVGFFSIRALDTLDIVSAAVIKHDVEIINIKEEIKLIRGGKQRTELNVDSPFRFRGRGPSRDVPRPPNDVPSIDKPEPRPQPKQDKPASGDDNRRDPVLPVQE